MEKNKNKRGAKQKAPRKQFHRQIPVGCFNEVIFIINSNIERWEHSAGETVRQLVFKQKYRYKHRYDYYRWIPVGCFDEIKDRVDAVISEYREMKKQIRKDGFLIQETDNVFIATKGQTILNKKTIYDLYEEIYDSREYNEQFKPGY